MRGFGVQNVHSPENTVVHVGVCFPARRQKLEETPLETEKVL